MPAPRRHHRGPIPAPGVPVTPMWFVGRVVVAVVAGSAVMVPSVLVELAEDRGGIGEVDSVELVALSAVFAVGAAAVAAVASGRAVARGHPAGDVLIAAFDGVVATASVGVVGLVGFLLLHVREEEAIGEGVGVEVATWSAIELAAVALGWATGRAALGWMARGRTAAGA